MSVDSVIKTCEKISQSGKTPSTALIKAKLGNKVALATIIKGFQIFKAQQDPNSDLLASMPTHNEELEKEKSSENEELVHLRNRVNSLELALKSLQKQVEDLSQR